MKSISLLNNTISIWFTAELLPELLLKINQHIRLELNNTVVIPLYRYIIIYYIRYLRTYYIYVQLQ